MSDDPHRDAMTVLQAQLHPNSSRLRCARCGAIFFSSNCVHAIAVDDMSDAEAARVHARWQIGKKCNPDHDTTSYRDAALADVDK